VTRLVPTQRALALLAIVALAACSHDGRTLRPAGPGQTASIITTTTSAPGATTTAGPSVQPGGSGDASTAASGITGDAGMTLAPPWADGAVIDTQYTCKGADTSPAISWTGVPATAKELALALVDLDADNYVHWVVAGIDPASTGIAAGKVPAGAIQAKNGFGDAVFAGPCPPDHQHTYLLTLYALGDHSGLADGVDGKTAIDALEAKQVASTAISGLFG
jgi:Raf kinase inhibitor-like YbhB/YbcL family protein